MRVVLLTDSLGCPREEINVEETWTEKILSDDRFKQCTFYTCCYYGLSVCGIPKRYINYLKPDIIVCQVGIVDACRRALTAKEEKKINRIPLLRSVIHIFCSKIHYLMTRFREVHDAGTEVYSNALDDLNEICTKQLILIEIAPPGEFLVNKTFNVANDIKKYNEVLNRKMLNTKTTVVRPFSDYGIEKHLEYILESDGHHLNQKGNDLVYEVVSNKLFDLVSQMNESDTKEKIHT